MNTNTIRRWFDVFKNGKELVEIRVLAKNRTTYSGYFTDIDTLLSEVIKFDDSNIYFTLNEINPACYSKTQHDTFVKNTSTTSDNDIIKRTWLLIDIDVQKPSDVNSTDSEKQLAKGICKNVYEFLVNNGFSRPVICDSANGYHLLLKQEMYNNQENTDIMKRFLMVLDLYFSTDNVKIDTSTFNASRICKLYGTFSRKGSNTPERPQRESKILYVPDEIKVTPFDYFSRIADQYPTVESSKLSASYDERFSIDDFIRTYGIEVKSDTVSGGVRKIVLKECPFDHSHEHSAIFVLPNGALGFKCFHNSCSQYRFKDLRLHFDKDAYTRRDYSEHLQKKRFNNPELVPPQHYVYVEESKDKGKKMLRFNEIEEIDLSKIEAIPTGIPDIDRKMKGLALGDISIISGTNGSGKSTWINSLMLNAAQVGYNSILFSGEMSAGLVKSWILLQAAGKEFIESEGDFYRVKPYAKEYINEWLADKIQLYNNNYGNKYEQVLKDMEDHCGDAKLFVLDNLMAIDLSGAVGDKNERQSEFINKVKELAERKRVHIILVAHPRKEVGFLRKESISGSADITNLAGNVFIIHRVNDDFSKKAADFYPQAKVGALSEYDNVVEVCKNRIFGTMDLTIGLYYEVESKRLKNSRGEDVHYGWQKNANIGADITIPPYEWGERRLTLYDMDLPF